MVERSGLGSLSYDTKRRFWRAYRGLRSGRVDQRTEAVGFADADLRMPGAGCLSS